MTEKKEDIGSQEGGKNCKGVGIHSEFGLLRKFVESLFFSFADQSQRKKSNLYLNKEVGKERGNKLEES